MSGGTVFDEVPGMEFVAVLQRALSYMQTGEVPDTKATYTDSGA